MRRTLACLFLSFLIAGGAAAASLWNDSSASPFVTQKPYKVGDVIMILIVETTSAVQKAGTDTQNQDSLSASFSHTIERLNPIIAPSNSLQGGRQYAYKGSGSTTRTSNVLATVAVTVSNVLPNGNLKIEGSHKVSVNDETQEISITGLLRPRDITGWNTVYSYQVADSQVSVKGAGAVGDSSSPGILSRVLNWLF